MSAVNRLEILMPVQGDISKTNWSIPPASKLRSESRCALRLQYVDLVVSIEVTVAVCCCFTVFSC
jgi:hypothetical protein